MTDADTPTPEDGLPTAGRPMGGGLGPGDGPTVELNGPARTPSSKPGDEPADQPASAGPPAAGLAGDQPAGRLEAEPAAGLEAEPPTVPIAVPAGAPASGTEDGDEPTVITPPASSGGGEETAGETPSSPDPVTSAGDDESADGRDAGSVRENDLVGVRDPDGPAVASPAVGAGRENTVRASWRKLSSASALIWVLLALFGFTLVVQLRSNDTDQGLATARQEDLVRILSDLEARDTRLSAEINTLEQSQRDLTSGVAGRQAALAEADKRADELGLLAGTLPGRGPGLRIIIDPKAGTVKASAVLNAVQELRGAGGEVMQLAGANGAAVRIVASTYFVDASGGGIIADGARLTAPYTLWVIGSPQTMQTALQIPGGVVASVESAGGSVAMDQRSLVEVTAVRKATDLQYARPVS